MEDRGKVKKTAGPDGLAAAGIVIFVLSVVDISGRGIQESDIHIAVMILLQDDRHDAGFDHFLTVLFLSYRSIRKEFDNEER